MDNDFMNARRSAWADEDIDDFEPSFDEPLKGFESKPDKDGIKHVISYVKDSKGSTIKITKKIKEVRNIIKINKNVVNRRMIMERNLADRFNSDTDVPKLGDEISIDVPKNTDSMNFQDKDNDDDYYFMDLPTSNNNKLSMFKKLGNNCSFIFGDEQIEKITYGQQSNTMNDLNNSSSGFGANVSPSGMNLGFGSSMMNKGGINDIKATVGSGIIPQGLNSVGSTGIAGIPAAGANRYQPPFLRTTSSSAFERGSSMQSSHRDDCTVRVANLSEDATEEDLQELFKTAGRVVKVFLAKNKNNSKNTKGFAFITYSKREEAQNAIRKLNRHGYDNLLLNVEWAKTKDK
ncbi:eukaryotic translation initiation factor [Cryptosporidium canis]|uniref:Eukaryotic translation initiation factor 3 subunit G n=1 Tax=Cryptosporidium canis TaxID=195482 RepID=A0ABQ8PCB5_9CRYT|nr:eukaryotic translation initiation factor [Cryptosporidium canis]KAJ1615332.1 eukaryotic translation initiation factor [Cryptosporidium canis]